MSGRSRLEAANAVEGLTLAASHADIDLVLLDVMLPDRDGLAGLRRRHPATSVALLSGTKDQQILRFRQFHEAGL